MKNLQKKLNYKRTSEPKKVTNGFTNAVYDQLMEEKGNAAIKAILKSNSDAHKAAYSCYLG